MDDITLLTFNNPMMVELKAKLAKLFTIANLGEMKQVVGLQDMHNVQKGMLKLLQSQYIS